MGVRRQNFRGPAPNVPLPTPVVPAEQGVCVFHRLLVGDGADSQLGATPLLSPARSSTVKRKRENTGGEMMFGFLRTQRFVAGVKDNLRVQYDDPAFIDRLCSLCSGRDLDISRIHAEFKGAKYFIVACGVLERAIEGEQLSHEDTKQATTMLSERVQRVRARFETPHQLFEKWEATVLRAQWRENARLGGGIPLKDAINRMRERYGGQRLP